MASNRPTLIPAPEPDAKAPSVLVVLDVDGVLNRLTGRRDGVWVRGFDQRIWSIDADLTVIRALDEQVRRSGVQLAWLTTWGSSVARIIERVFDGLLSDGYVLFEPVMMFGEWKVRALLDHLDEIGEVPYVWADDEAVASAMVTRPSFADASGRGGEPRLLLWPSSPRGLLMADVKRIAKFIDLHASAES